MKKVGIDGNEINESFENILEEYATDLSSLMYALRSTLTPIAVNGSAGMNKLAEDVSISHIKALLTQGVLPHNSENEKSLFEIYDALTLVYRTYKAFELSMQSCVVSCMCVFEAYIAKLVRLLYAHNPHYLNKKKNLFSYSDIEKYTKEELSDKFLDYSVSVFMNESKKEQFKKLGKILGEKIYGDLYEPEFAEICERRHLFVHSGGVITANYLKNCKDCNVDGISSLREGEKIQTDVHYIQKCFQTLYVNGIIIGQLIWRKCVPMGNQEADDFIIHSCLELIKEHYYTGAYKLLHHANNKLKESVSKENIPLFQINTALVYYLLGNKELCNKRLNELDWTQYDVKYQLGEKVLRDDFEAAAALMSKSDFSEVDYFEMPIFQEFIKSDAFEIEFVKLFCKNPKDCIPKLIQPFENLNSMLGIKQTKEELIKIQEILSQFTNSNISLDTTEQ